MTRLRLTLFGGLGLALALTVFVNIAMLVVPIYDMQLYDRVLQSRNMDTLAALSLACVIGLGLYAAVDYLRSACLVTLGEAVGRRLSGRVLEEGVRRAAAGDARAGAALVRDLNEVQGFLISGAVAVPLDALCAPLSVGVLYLLHPAFCFLATAGIAALVLAGLLAEWLVRPALLAAQERRAVAGHGLSRSIGEPELTEGLGMLPAIARRWAVRHGEALAALDRVGTRAMLVSGLSRLVRMGAQGGVMGLGALLVLAGATTPGSLMGANLLVNKSLAPFDQLVGSWRHWTMAHAAWRRMMALLATPIGVQGGEWAVPGVVPETTPGVGAGLVVRDAWVRAADGAVLLRGVGFEAAPGRLVVVAGPNGAGKTTLLRLLAGVVAAEAGGVWLDGVAVGEGAVGFLPQSVGLLTGSVLENVGRFRDTGPEPAMAAARRVEIHEAVGRMARGYETALSMNGASLSGGMRQRVGLARALLASPRLVVLDEPDASLDAEGAAALLRALRACCAEGAIVVATSHRPALRAAADMVIELRDGVVLDEAACAA